MLIVFLSIAALFCAIFSGMFGMAGGILLLAILFGIDFPHHIAIPLHGAVMLISHIYIIANYIRHVYVPAFLMFVLGTIPSIILIPFIINSINRHFAQLIISIIIIYITWAPERIRIKNPLKSIKYNMLVAGLIGGVSSLAIGSAGTFIAPLYLRKEWDAKTLMGTKSACMGYLQLLKIATYSAMGFKVLEHLDLLVPLGISVILGNMIGIYFLGMLSTTNYRFLYKSVLTFAVVLLLADIVFDHYGSIV